MTTVGEVSVAVVKFQDLLWDVSHRMGANIKFNIIYIMRRTCEARLGLFIPRFEAGTVATGNIKSCAQSFNQNISGNSGLLAQSPNHPQSKMTPIPKNLSHTGTLSIIS